MHFQGQELISRSTYRSSRSLIILSFSVILISRLDISADELNIFQVEPGEEKLSVAAFWVLLFLTANHLLSWVGDLNSFRGWNVATKMGGASRFGRGGSPLQSQLDNAIASIDNVKEASDTLGRKFNDDNVTSLTKLNNDQIDMLKKMNTWVGVLDWHARLYLYGWFLALPLGLAAWASLELCKL